ncbi:hypothetical protein [Spirosoma endbachense]|uniref:Uncharacterized protein n=1 Tax=Spirosoma endbachense TaxID=2666025 RepID=A0A6P1VUS7_9BACT|nr:hypothetical protein [Spirosoma endbachense]QHV95389.1 hypothetical protein GJR95_10375 [Spirosoma endbachense]
MHKSIAILIALGAVAFFILLWCGIIYTISYASGWQKLAETYSTSYVPNQTKNCNCLFQKSSSYNGVVQYASTKEGLYLKTINLFSIGHNPLFIPWKDIESYESGDLIIPYKNRLIAYSAKFKVKGITIFINQDVRALQIQY